MFTLKHVHANGEEEIIEAETVRFEPRPVPTQQTTQPPATLWVRAPGRFASGGEHPLTGGEVFVMNSAGKTVARYFLGANEPMTLEQFDKEVAAGHARQGLNADTPLGSQSE